MTAEDAYRKTARLVRNTADDYLKGLATAGELDHAVELWLLEREKVRAR